MDVWEQLRNDPSSVMEYRATLQSGNEIRGTIGPMVGHRVVMQMRFSRPPTDQDREIADEFARDVMGGSPEGVFEGPGSEAAVRRLMGGGIG